MGRAVGRRPQLGPECVPLVLGPRGRCLLGRPGHRRGSRQPFADKFVPRPYRPRLRGEDAEHELHSPPPGESGRTWDLSGTASRGTAGVRAALIFVQGRSLQGDLGCLLQPLTLTITVKIWPWSAIAYLSDCASDFRTLETRIRQGKVPLIRMPIVHRKQTRTHTRTHTTCASTRARTHAQKYRHAKRNSR